MWMRMLSVSLVLALLLSMMTTLIVCGCDDVRRWCRPPNPEIDAMKSVMRREAMVQLASDMVSRLTALNDERKPMETMLKGMLEHFLVLRDASVDVVEAAVVWRRDAARKRRLSDDGSAPLPVFMWRGSDYLHKMCNDLDFLASCQPLVGVPAFIPMRVCVRACACVCVCALHLAIVCVLVYYVRCSWRD
jgi:hypothetical protein